MTFDVKNASLVAGGEGVPLKPIELEGLQVEPPILTKCSQLTGDTDTVLVARHSGGRARVFGVVKDLPPTEATIVSTSGAQLEDFAVGFAVWATLVIVQHRNAGRVSALWVMGAVAALADAVYPTFDQIKTALGLDDEEATFAIAGDVRYTRTSDLVIDVATTGLRRPAYTDDSKKTGYLADEADKSTLGRKPGGRIDLTIDLIGFSAVAPGALAIDGVPVPDLPYGGRFTGWKYVPGKSGTGAGADITLKAQMGGTVLTGSLNLLLANAVLGQLPSASFSANYDFGPGDTLDVEVDAVAAAFTAGFGTLQFYYDEYVP